VSIVLIGWSAWRLYQEAQDTQRAIATQQQAICQLAQNVYFTQLAIAHHLHIPTPVGVPLCTH
jgi:hypothetical protein